jgi:hypothetical protein
MNARVDTVPEPTLRMHYWFANLAVRSFPAQEAVGSASSQDKSWEVAILARVSLALETLLPVTSCLARG